MKEVYQEADAVSIDSSRGVRAPVQEKATRSKAHHGSHVGMVEEEKYLTLQMENRRLKQEAVERDGKFKQTLARLARAEEAAKRATLASSSNRGAAGGGRIQGTPTTARLFAAEQRATELEEEARELTRKLQREHERGLHFKNLCKEYKVKLDEALKSARSRQPTMRPPGESLAASLAAKQGKSSPTKDDPGASDQLRQERARTAALAKERDELRRLLHAAGGQVPGLSIGGASVALSKRDGSEWVLEHFVHNQQPYLLDRATLKVYSAPTSEKEWPEPVGRLVGGRLHMPTKHEDLFKALDTYLKREQIHLKAAYDRFDADHSGELDTSELGRLLHEVMPGVKHAQQRYFRTMLDINNDGKVTYAEMVESLKECIAVGEKAGAGGGSVELNDILVKLKDYISTKNSTVHVIFNEFDKDSNGSLEQRELVAMFSKLVPNLTPKEKRFLLAHIAKLDLDGDGKISLAELRKALRAVTLSLVEPDGSKATRSSASNVQVGAGRLVLQEYVVHGKMFLLDPKKAYVYNMLSTPDEWLRPLGKVANGVIVAPATSRDLVETLDATLKKQQARLKDFFDAFDSDKSGSLQISELSALLQKLMPGAAAADLRFFQILLDSDGDGHITYQELVTCIKNIISASQASSERGNMDVERALQKLKNLVRNNLGDLRKTFDTSAGGKLTYVQLLGLLRQLMPGSSPQERRYITAFLRQLDLDNSGAVSYEELAYALRVLEVVIVSADGSTPSTSVPQHRRGGASEWYLEDVSLNGHSYLLDRHTLRVYTPTTGAGQWPQLAGRLQGGRLITFERTQEQRFIQGLDTYLKSQQSRLKDVFDTFDRDRGGSLNRNEVAAMLRALMPDASAGDVQYFRMLLDIDGDGEVTFNEFVNGIKDAIAASNTTVHGQTAGGSPELAAVLKILKDFVTSNGISLAQAFDQFDQGKTGYLTHSDLLGMLHTLVPNLTAAERKHVVHHLRALDADGDGRITLAELYQAFRMAEVKRGKPEPPQAARAPAPPPPQQVWGAPQHTSYGGGGGGVSVDAAEMANLREAASEVTYLRQQLRDTKALCAELEGALTRERDTALPQYPFPDGGDGGETTFTAGELQGEIKSAWERAGILQKRYHEAQAALGTMKANHTRVLQQLDDTHKRLNQERKENLKLAAEEKRLAMELEAARELEPMLEQARQERLALEKENHQLLAAAMNAPTEAQSEARRLRSMMMEAQRERSAAELRESDLKRTVQLLGGGGVEDAKVVRMERDRLRADVSRMEVELEASHDKIRVFMEMGHNARLAGTVGRHADMAPSDANMDEGTLRAELRGLRETYSDQVEELRKAQKLLRLEEAQVEDLRAALSEEKARAGKLNEDLYRKVQAHENELDRRQKKIHKLEAQLRRLLSGGSIIEPSEPKTMRASRDGTTRFGGSDEDDMDDLAPGENIFELRLLGVDIDKAVVGEDNPATFMTVDFFEHETQATAVHSGLNVTSDHTLQYVVKTDDFFLEYLDTRHLPVELNKSMGLDFAAIGVAHVNLRRVLDDAQTGHTSKSPPIHFCDVIGRSGEIIARLRYSAFMRRGIIAAVRAYRQLPAPRPPPGVDAADPIAVAHAAAAGAPGASSLIKIELSCCRELVPRAGSASTLVPYCTYQFPGLASHDTTYGRGANPEFHDAHEFPLARTAALERRLERAALEVIAFDDADMDLEGAGVIGIARVDLEPLSKGLPVQGAFPLFSQTREKRGTVYISIAWKDPLHDDAAHMAKFELPPPASGPARVSAAPSAVVRGGGRDMEEDTGFGLSAEFHGGRKPTPTSPTSISIGATHTQLGARGQQRYGAVDDSIDAPGWQQQQQSAVGALAAAASALEGSADKIVVSIGQLELGSTLYHDHRVRQMFMLFELLPKFHRDDEQQTMRVKKESHIMDFAYTRVFSVRDAGLRTALASLLRAKNEEEASVPFCLVSDDNGIDFEDIGFFELNLHDVYEKGDFLDRRVEVLDKNDVCIGTVTISVVAQTALRSIMSSA